MVMTQKKFDLSKYRGNGSSLFTGRPQGQAARADLKLDDLDKNEDLEVTFTIPEGTTSFNPSFYLGFLYNSYKNLGEDAFAEKYKFEVQSNDALTKKVIEQNLEDGNRNAINELNKKTGLRQFLTKKV